MTKQEKERNYRRKLEKSLRKYKRQMAAQNQRMDGLNGEIKELREIMEEQKKLMKVEVQDGATAYIGCMYYKPNIYNGKNWDTENCNEPPTESEEHAPTAHEESLDLRQLDNGTVLADVTIPRAEGLNAHPPSTTPTGLTTGGAAMAEGAVKRRDKVAAGAHLLQPPWVPGGNAPCRQVDPKPRKL